MAIEYLGHKESHLDFLLSPLDKLTRGRPHRVADIFCGTATVSTALKKRGHAVLANDSLAMCATFARASLLNDGEPRFRALKGIVGSAGSRSMYERVLQILQGLPPRDGFITLNYSPRSAAFAGLERRYFTEENAQKIDAIRAQIEEWGPLLLPQERAVLLSDLVRAANAVSNIAGTYGCYLKTWKVRALASLRLEPSSFSPGGTQHKVTCMDAAALAPSIEADIVYADPPYTKRQYSAYYHIPETIVLDDSPPLDGSTGLRPWKDKKSDWCYRRRAPSALSQLVASTRCEWFMFSYNDDGQIRHDEIMDILLAHGRVSMHAKTTKRYKSANRPHKGAEVTERLYVLRKTR